MPSGDEGTGLHAFDDLDPISTVSALNVQPEDESGRVPGPLSRSAPPPPPPRRINTLAMPAVPPPPRAGAASRSVPPPPPTTQRSDGATPPPAPFSFHEQAAETDGEDPGADEDTRVVPTDDYPHEVEAANFAQPDAQDGAEFEDFDTSGVSTGLAPLPAGREPGMDDSELLELSATTVATNIDMDWDEEDVQTKLRDEGDVDMLAGAPASGSPLVNGRPSPFPTAMPSYPGNPSPFASSAPPSAFTDASRPAEWENEEDARTRVMSVRAFPPPPALPAGWGFHGGDSLTPASNTQTLLGTQRPASSQTRLAWVGVAAAAVIGAAFGARTLLSNAEPATVTIVTKPTDAEVLVDGRPLVGGQSSPFTVQGLAPEESHVIVVRKPGYTEQVHHLSLNAGELKELPRVDLAPMRVDTGFALASVPAGASIYVDDKKLDTLTPARVTDLDPGLHVIRLDNGAGYQPWETQVALASGQVIELPTARLVGGGGSARTASRSADAPRAAASSSRSSSSGGSSSRSRSERASAQPRRERAPQRVAAPTPAPAPMASVAQPAGPARVSGAQGTLRLNSRPWSQVYVDGRLIGNTPQMSIPLSPGSHNVKLVNPQLGMNKSLKIKIQKGQMTTKIVELME